MRAVVFFYYVVMIYRFLSKASSYRPDEIILILKASIGIICWSARTLSITAISDWKLEPEEESFKEKVTAYLADAENLVKV